MGVATMLQAYLGGCELGFSNLSTQRALLEVGLVGPMLETLLLGGLLTVVVRVFTESRLAAALISAAFGASFTAPYACLGALSYSSRLLFSQRSI